VGVQEYSMDANPIKTHKHPVRQTLVKCVFLCCVNSFDWT